MALLQRQRQQDEMDSAGMVSNWELIQYLLKMLHDNWTKIGSGILRRKEIRGIGDCCGAVKKFQILEKKMRERADGGRGYLDTGQEEHEEEETQQHERDFGEAANPVASVSRLEACVSLSPSSPSLYFVSCHLPLSRSEFRLWAIHCRHETSQIQK